LHHISIEEFLFWVAWFLSPLSLESLLQATKNIYDWKMRDVKEGKIQLGWAFGRKVLLNRWKKDRLPPAFIDIQLFLFA
jgi:hypothetical protein